MIAQKIAFVIVPILVIVALSRINAESVRTGLAFTTGLLAIPAILFLVAIVARKVATVWQKTR